MHHLEVDIKVPRFFGVDVAQRRHTVDCSILLALTDDHTLRGTFDVQLCHDKHHRHLHLLESVELIQCNGTHIAGLAPVTLTCRVNHTLSTIKVNAFGRTDRVQLFPRRKGFTPRIIESYAQAQHSELPVVAITKQRTPSSPFALFVLHSMNLERTTTTSRVYAHALTENNELSPAFEEKTRGLWQVFRDLFKDSLKREHMKDGVLEVECTSQTKMEKAELHLLLRVNMLII